MAKHFVTGKFTNTEGKRIDFVSMKVFADHAKARAYELEAARKLRNEGCKTITLRIQSV